MRDVVRDIDTAIETTERAIVGLGGNDVVSQDIAIGIKAALQRNRWLLASHLAS